MKSSEHSPLSSAERLGVMERCLHEGQRVRKGVGRERDRGVGIEREMGREKGRSRDRSQRERESFRARVREGRRGERGVVTV